jgi:hypothetical protein
MFALPPIYKGESFWSARERVKLAFCKDPLFWSALPILFFLFAQLFNPRGSELIGAYNPGLKKTVWEYAPAKTEWLPASFEPFSEDATGGMLFVALLVGITCALVIRCALPRKQRLALLIGLALLSGGYGFLFTCFGSSILPALGDIERGVLFVLMLCVSLGIAIEHFLEHRLSLCVWGLAGAVLNGFALMALGSPLTAVIGLAVIVIYICFSISMVMGKGRGKRFVWAVILILPMLLGPGLGLAVTKTTGPWSLITNEYARQEMYAQYDEQWTFRTDAAVDLSREHLLLGQGSDAFDYLVPLQLKGKKMWRKWEAAEGLPSDIFTFLLEQGFVGIILFFLPFIVLLIQTLMTLVEYAQNRHMHYSLRYVFIAITSAIGLVVAFAMTTFATPLHSPIVLCAMFIVFATLRGWLPRKR